MRFLFVSSAVLLEVALAGFEFEFGERQFNCGSGMSVTDAGCGMDSEVDGIVLSGKWTYEMACEQCKRVMEEEGAFEGCEGTAVCTGEYGGFFGSIYGVRMSSTPAPRPPSPPSSPPPMPPMPPAAPRTLFDDICPEGMEEEDCQKLMLGGAGGCAALISVGVVLARRGGGYGALL